MHWDAIVIGQGISGSVLARTLQKWGKTVLVIDDHLKGSSSMVAAGLWNPIVFKKLNKTWMADTLLPAAKEFYQLFEEEFGTKCWHEREVVRAFSSIEEQNNWMARSGEPGFSQYLDSRALPEMNDERIRSEHSYGQVLGAGNLSVPAFIDAFRSHLSANSLLLEERFHHSQLEITDTAVKYKEHSAQHIFFCEGQQGVENPWFNYLPLHQTKGEVLTVRIPSLKIDRILNRGFFIMPVEDDVFRVGATFNWKEKDELPTETGKSELIAKLDAFIGYEYEVIDHVAGLRPTVTDRRPLIGQHPELQQLVQFNGMGPKAVIYAPFTARNLLESVYEDKPLHEEASIRRFDKHYRKIS